MQFVTPDSDGRPENDLGEAWRPTTRVQQQPYAATQDYKGQLKGGEKKSPGPKRKKTVGKIVR